MELCLADGNTNETLKLATGENASLLDYDGILAEYTLYEVAKMINKFPNMEFIYFDEDKITLSGERFSSYFKSDFSLEMLECHNNITHMVDIKIELLENVGLLNSKIDGA